MKKIISILIMSFILFSSVSASAATMYSLDGRTINVSSKEVSAYQKVGWYTEPVMTVYAPDGRSIVIAKSEYYAWKSVGWYKYPVLYMYAPDGRRTVVAVSEFGQWYNVGWSNIKGTRPYAEWLTDLNAVTQKMISTSRTSWFDYNTGEYCGHSVYPSESGLSCYYSEIYDKNSIEYYIGKKYAFLSGTWGVREGTNIEGSAIVKVYADDKKIYEGPAINAKSDPINFTLDVRNCKYLRIKFVPLDKKASDYDYFVLGNLKLYRR